MRDFFSFAVALLPSRLLCLLSSSSCVFVLVCFARLARYPIVVGRALSGLLGVRLAGPAGLIFIWFVVVIIVSQTPRRFVGRPLCAYHHVWPFVLSLAEHFLFCVCVVCFAKIVLLM